MRVSEQGTRFEEMWIEACKFYEAKSGRRFQADKQLMKLGSIDDLKTQITGSSKIFKDSKKRDNKLWTSLSKCLDLVVALGGPLQNSVSSVPAAPAVFAGVLHLFEVRNPVSSRSTKLSPHTWFGIGV